MIPDSRVLKIRPRKRKAWRLHPGREREERLSATRATCASARRRVIA
jgi:hypothetical protein